MENLVESLYRAHFAEMLLLASRKLIRREDAPDIVHDVFLLAWQREALLAAHENPGGWLFRTLQFRILRENALAHHPRRRRGSSASILTRGIPTEQSGRSSASPRP